MSRTSHLRVQPDERFLRPSARPRGTVHPGLTGFPGLSASPGRVGPHSSAVRERSGRATMLFEHGAHIARRSAVIPGELDLSISEVGHARERPFEVSLHLAPIGVQLDSNAIESVGSVRPIVAARARARRTDER
jgi:hypothetical protein